MPLPARDHGDQLRRPHLAPSRAPSHARIDRANDDHGMRLDGIVQVHADDPAQALLMDFQHLDVVQEKASPILFLQPAEAFWQFAR
ncbi:MAG TPA: hypothetical protein VFF96_07335 [Pseudoxanthomonas sp.]|nr:hypothetical protein [Pseudoxanthomonas sp.]